MVQLRRAAVVLLVVALALAVGGSLAAAKKKKKHKPKGGTWASQVTLTLPTITHFEGTVSSELDACRGQRLVTVYYKDPNSENYLPLSVQRTDNDGRYAFDLPKPAYPGTYQAQLEEQRVHARKASQMCQGAPSVGIVVSGSGP
jgi:hypothetical protein